MLRKLRTVLDDVSLYFVHTQPREDIERWQLRKLKELLGYARENVPFYTARLPVLDDTFDLEAYTRYPILTKEAFRDREVDEYTDVSAAPVGRWNATSGTSGNPFSFIAHGHSYEGVRAEFMRYRFLYWDRGLLWRALLGKPVFTDIKIVRMLMRSPQRANQLFVPVGKFLARPRSLIGHMRRFDPDVIEAYATILLRLAQEETDIRSGLRCRYAVSAGEQLTGAARRTIESVFACRVFDRYGMEEFGALAVECREHDGLHVSSESFLIEIVDDSGAPCADGEQGRVVVTDLFNHSMPFIRYDTGDHGRLTWDPCPCGVTAPRLWLEGRYATFLSFGVRKIHHLEFDVALETFMNHVLQYQVAKVGPTQLEVRVVPGHDFSSETEHAIVRKLTELVGHTTTVELVRVDRISRALRGKSQIVVDETKEAL